MIDLTKRQKLYQIKLEDGTILNIKRPSQQLLMKIVGLRDIKAENKQDLAFEMVDAIQEMIVEIFNRNTDNRHFTNEDIAEMLDFETELLIIQDYLTEASKALGE